MRVTDFGIARIAGDVSLTSAGTILGTSGYMSPEQAVGGKATAASDRYGLAVVAFELLAGRRPYVAETFASEAAAHATAPIPSATALDPTLPPAVDDVFERGLAKAPDDRFRSCGELVSSLQGAFAAAAATTMRVLPPAAAVEASPAAAAAAAAASAPPARESSVSLHRGARRRNAIVLAALLALVLLGALVAVMATRDEGSSVEAVTVLRTATVSGTPQVRTVTVQSEQPTTTASAPAAASPPPSSSGASLNDRGFRLLQGGNAAAALPLLEQAVTKLEGTGSLAEAYASYNLAWARFATGSCEGVKDLLERSKRIQGKRKEIDQLRHEVDKGCKREH